MRGEETWPDLPAEAVGMGIDRSIEPIGRSTATVIHTVRPSSCAQPAGANQPCSLQFTTTQPEREREPHFAYLGKGGNVVDEVPAELGADDARVAAHGHDLWGPVVWLTVFSL